MFEESLVGPVVGLAEPVQQRPELRQVVLDRGAWNGMSLSLTSHSLYPLLVSIVKKNTLRPCKFLRLFCYFLTVLLYLQHIFLPPYATVPGIEPMSRRVAPDWDLWRTELQQRRGYVNLCLAWQGLWLLLALNYYARSKRTLQLCTDHYVVPYFEILEEISHDALKQIIIHK